MRVAAAKVNADVSYRDAIENYREFILMRKRTIMDKGMERNISLPIIVEELVRHLSNLKIYLMLRIRLRILAITSSCIRLKHIAISAIPETHKR